MDAKRIICIALTLVFFLTAMAQVFKPGRGDQNDTELARAVIAMRALKQAASFPDRFRQTVITAMETLQALSGKTKVIQKQEVTHTGSSWSAKFVFRTHNFACFQALSGKLFPMTVFSFSIFEKPSTPPPEIFPA